MIVAYITTEKEAIAALFHQDYEDFFAATPWLYLFACMLILLFGPRPGLDRWLMAPSHHVPALSRIIITMPRTWCSRHG